MESRQGQFPATFPDTFKNFFSMLNEEEDHVELFSNLLEDKVTEMDNLIKIRLFCNNKLPLFLHRLYLVQINVNFVEVLQRTYHRLAVVDMAVVIIQIQQTLVDRIHFVYHDRVMTIANI